MTRESGKMRAFPRRNPVERGVVEIGIPPAIVRVLKGRVVLWIEGERMEGLERIRMKFFYAV